MEWCRERWTGLEWTEVELACVGDNLYEMSNPVFCKLGHFMQIVSNRDNLHKMSKSHFLGKIRKYQFVIG